jgi:hypothetical protein
MTKTGFGARLFSSVLGTFLLFATLTERDRENSQLE